MEEKPIELTKEEIDAMKVPNSRTYKGKSYSILVRNSVRRMNALYFAKLLAYIAITVFVIFHLISVMRVCKFIAKAPTELPQTIKKEQLCEKNNYDC